MLLTRIKTALVLLPVVLLALFGFPDWGWGLFCVVLIGTAAWEWARLSQLSGLAAQAFIAAVVLAMLVIVFSDVIVRSYFPILFPLAAACAIVALAFWVVVVPWWLGSQYRPARKWVGALAGAAVLIPTFMALVVLRLVNPWLLLSFAVIVWVADIAAYFAGKNFGRRKLAPAISPGKTVEGAVGGLVGVALFYFLWRWMATQYGLEWAGPLLDQGHLLLAVFLLLGVASIFGDLFESWIKRGAGMKDSSGLLPGHGGVLDRIDALTSTLPLAMAYMLFTGATGSK
jgi:phosphatidate cytidylyltransferase